MSRPTAGELSDFLSDLAGFRAGGGGDYAALMDRKADLLERIAADMPGDEEAAQTATLARARANDLKAAG
ncbi:hypothetical protein [Actinacidiphila paucisporea]|uniref:Uncharacterized protein n=1 Tax=Actinacidiphila paucisporea TaxID=310782 RepID=A0A1M7CPU9_9ACTN|nr:hypothetical protein [Actinacidiphila paucisporea]SHL69331.1 hypothetical protein SAMN05216499_105314 [Actinacidiphila paucisporea]